MGKKLATLIALWLAAYAIKGPATDPDVAFGAAQWVGTGLLFGLFFVAVADWGAWLLARFGFASSADGLGMAIAFGSGGAAWAAFALAHLGLCSFFMWPGWVLLCLLGTYLRGRSQIAVRFREDLGWMVLAILASGTLLNGFIPSGGSDPLLYHVFGPRLWAEAGQAVFPTSNSAFAQCGLWDYLYLWPQVLLGGAKGYGLIEAQIFSQWIHWIFGMGGSALMLVGLARASGIEALGAAMVLVASLGSASLREVMVQAKNDWGALFWLLGGIKLGLAEMLGSNPLNSARFRSLLWAGAFAGMAVASKLNSAFMIASAVLVGLLLEWRRKGAISALIGGAVWGVGILAAHFPFLFRNCLISGGNPFFPLVHPERAAGWFGPSWLEYFSGYQPVTDLRASFVLDQARWIFRDNPLNWLFAVALGMMFFSRSARRCLPGVVAILLGASWFLVTRIPNPFLRWIGLPLLGLAGGSAAIILRGLPRAAPKWMNAAGLALALVFTVPQSVRELGWSHSILGPPNEVIRDPRVHRGGAAKAWLRLNPPAPGERVVSTGDDQLYYVTALAVVPIVDDPDLDRLTFGLTDVDEWVRRLRREGIRYVLDTRHFTQEYWSQASYMLSLALKAHPGAVSYEEPTSRVIDLVVLQQDRALACIPAPPIF